jgi:hypothetical protein
VTGDDVAAPTEDTVEPGLDVDRDPVARYTASFEIGSVEVITATEIFQWGGRVLSKGEHIPPDWSPDPREVHERLRRLAPILRTTKRHHPYFEGYSYPSDETPAVILFLPQFLFYVGVLPAYRVLMVWVYDRTGSLLVAMLMHASLTASTLILGPLAVSGVPLLTWNLVLAGALWVFVAAVAVAKGGHLSRQPLRGRVARGSPPSSLYRHR